MRMSGVALPVVASVCIGLGVTSLWWALPAIGFSFLAGLRMERVRPAAVVFAVLVAAGVLVVGSVPSWIVLGLRFVALAVSTGMGPWLLGRFWRQSQELVRAGWERAERLEREQQLVAEQARLRERARIAQDMHDALGHDLSLIALRAGALKLAPDLAPPHREAVQEIRAGAAAAVDRLGEVIGILRDGDESGGTARAAHGPADSDIPHLVAEAAAAGLDVRSEITGAPDGLPRATEHAAYRVVQEALTNAAKHAPRATVTVEVAYSADGARLRVANGPAPVAVPTPTPTPASMSVPAPVPALTVAGATGSAPASTPRSATPTGTFTGAFVGTSAALAGRPVSTPAMPLTGGRGLVGLTERVRLAGGTFAHGARPDGGFEVAATLPRRAAGPVPLPPAAPSSPVRELRRARRRVGRTLAAVVLVPLVTAVLLTVALRVWTLYVVSLSVLDPEVYASLQVGQDQASVERLLPGHRLPYRPPSGPATPAPPSGEGVSCAYYAITAQLFVDRAGDAYRLCFQDSRLVARDVLVS
ncbi:sensor histidine kinase [Kitasatospora sp. NPDC057512]|uniref:sensor histidine kinase n=1 Tax=Kitasatospora sp. NPDC057512 TaxID=3346154 RepID=UPI0036941F30